MKRLWRTAIVTLLLTTGCSATGPTISAGPGSQAATAPISEAKLDPSTTDPTATTPRTEETTLAVPEPTSEFTLVTQPPPDGVPDLGPILLSDYGAVRLDNLADITPDEPFDSLTVVAAKVRNYGIDDEPRDFRIEASIGQPCKAAKDESCKTNFTKATTTQPEKWFVDGCGNCAEYTVRFLVVTKGDDVRAGLAELSVFGQIDTPTEVAWTYVSIGRYTSLVRKIDGGFEALESFYLDECEPHITRMIVSQIKPDGTLVPVRFHDDWPEFDTGYACP
jgi:hypothetical protein